MQMIDWIVILELYKKKDGQYYMGDKVVWVDDNDIYVEGNRYVNTPGLWALVMYKKPHHSLYTNQDVAKYKKLIYQTNAMTEPNNLRETSRITSTYKW